VTARDGAVLVDGSHGVPGRLGDEFLELGGGEQPEPVAILDDALLAFQGAERGLVEPAPLAVNRLAERGLGHSVRLGGENGQEIRVRLLDGRPAHALEVAVGVVEAVGRPTAGARVAERRH
jgi:hypothetical protein